MTAQIGDIYRYEGTEYTCLKRRGEGFFDPKEYGMRPVRMNLACSRGFWCEYDIAPSGLILQNLHIKAGFGMYPPVNGVSATGYSGEFITEEENGFDCGLYSDDDLPDPEEVPETEEELPVLKEEVPKSDADPVKPGTVFSSSSMTYKGLALPIDLTGKILLGADFDGAYYIHMGFQRPYGYRKLLSLEFGHGLLKEVLDFSETAERIRGVCEMSDVFFTMMPSSPGAKEAAIPPDVKEKIWWNW